MAEVVEADGLADRGLEQAGAQRGKVAGVVASRVGRGRQQRLRVRIGHGTPPGVPERQEFVQVRGKEQVAEIEVAVRVGRLAAPHAQQQRQAGCQA